MAFFRNLGVNRRDSLCDVLKYVSAQSLDFLDLAQKFSFLDWKLTSVHHLFVDGHQQNNNLMGLELKPFPKACQGRNKKKCQPPFWIGRCIGGIMRSHSVEISLKISSRL